MYQNLLSNFSWISILSLWTIHDPCAALKTRQPVSHRLCHMWQQLTNTCDTSFISPKTLQRVNVVPYTSIHKRWSSYITPRMYCLAVLGERKENKKGHKNTFGQDNNYWKRNQTWAPHTLFCVFNNVILFFSLAWNFLIGPLVEFELIQRGPPFCQKNMTRVLSSVNPGWISCDTRNWLEKKKFGKKK